MTNFNLPNEPFLHTHLAHEEARHAGIQANFGYRHKQDYYASELMLRKWRELLVNAPILLHNSLFSLFAVADMIVSWEMIRSIVYSTSIAPQGLVWLPTLIFCLLINAWAATTAHFIGKGWSREIQDWERWNYIFVKNRNLPLNILNDELRRDFKRTRQLAYASGTALLAVVSGIIYYRVIILPQVSKAATENLIEPTNNPLEIILVILPLAILAGELLTGDYVWYSIQRLQTVRRRNLNREKFFAHKASCGAFDLQAIRYTAAAQQHQEDIEVFGDLEKSYLRLKHRSQQNDDYLDPFDPFRRIGFTFHYRSNSAPVADVKVFGILPNGAKTGDYVTDEQGKVTLHWDGEADRLVAIQILGHEYLGPFQSNAEHYIDISDPIPVSSNGNGQHEPAETM